MYGKLRTHPYVSLTGLEGIKCLQQGHSQLIKLSYSNFLSIIYVVNILSAILA